MLFSLLFLLKFQLCTRNDIIGFQISTKRQLRNMKTRHTKMMEHEIVSVLCLENDDDNVEEG